MTPNKPYRVAFVTTHPIQYQVPVFREATKNPDLDFEVLFCMIPDSKQQGDGFGVAFEWDIPLLEGYKYRVLNNVSPNPSVTVRDGCDTPEIYDVLKKEKFDAVIINGWVVKSCLQTLSACRKLGIPCIVRGEANILRPRAWWKQWLHGILIRRYSAYLYIGESNKKFYLRHKAKEEQLFPALYCIENDRFQPGDDYEERRTSFRNQLKIPHDETVFLFCGKLEEKKHPLELIQAFHKAREANPAGHLLIVGDGVLRQECEDYIAKHNLPVTMAGFLNQSEITNAYYASDCIVLASDHGETWGLVVNEAMAAGLPAIVSDQVGCNENLIQHGITGDFYPFGDWDQLSQKLAEFASGKHDLKAMGRNANQLIQKYSPAAAAEGIYNAAQYVTRSSR